MTPLVPLHGGGHGGRAAESSLAALPFFGSTLLLILLLALLGFYLWRQGTIRLGGRRPPEDDAKRILAERFARGDIDSDEFMERASILNWAPGTDSLSSKPGKRPRST